MPEDMGFEEDGRRGWKARLGAGLAGPALAAAMLFPFLAFGEGLAVAQVAHDHGANAASVQAELAQVRAATARFHRVDEAVAAGYELGWVNGAGNRIVAGCVSSPTAGAMGYHYFNAALMADNAVDELEPEVLVYAPSPDGLELVAVEWVVRSAQSNPPGVSTPPSVLGMPMHILVPPPGPAFYLTHAWIWADNPAGMFADFNPAVSC
jgi:hypothetical protein